MSAVLSGQMLRSGACSKAGSTARAHQHGVGRHIAATLGRVHDRENVLARLAGSEGCAVERDGGGVRAVKASWCKNYW